MANLLCEFRMAEKKDAKLINIKKGKVILVNATSQFHLLVSHPQSPGAIKKINSGIIISIIRTKKNNPTTSKLKILFANFCDSFFIN